MLQAIIEFIWNKEFGQNVASELCGIIIEVVVISIIVKKIIDGKRKDNYTIFIMPLLDNLCDLHARQEVIYNSTTITNEPHVRYIMWCSSVIDVIEAINSHRIYEVFPELGQKLLKYSIALKEVKQCVKTQKFNDASYSECVSHSTDIVDDISNIYNRSDQIIDRQFQDKLKEILRAAPWK